MRGRDRSSTGLHLYHSLKHIGIVGLVDLRKRIGRMGRDSVIQVQLPILQILHSYLLRLLVDTAQEQPTFLVRRISLLLLSSYLP